jgi:hypothetical protein
MIKMVLADSRIGYETLGKKARELLRWVRRKFTERLNSRDRPPAKTWGPGD